MAPIKTGAKIMPDDSLAARILQQELWRKAVAYPDLVKRVYPMLTRSSFASFHRYANIVLFKTYASLKAETEKTYIGCFWWILEPLINTVIFYLVFACIMKNRSDNILVFIFIGNLVYGWFSNAINGGAVSLIANSHLFQHIYLPKIIFPIISVANASWKFLFSFIVLMPLLWWFGMPITPVYFALPFLLALQFFLIVGIALPMAALVPFFQDSKTVLAAVLNLLMWLSGVFYDGSQLPESLRKWFYANPAAVLIDSFRAVLMHGRWPHRDHLLILVGEGIALWVFGILVMNRIDRSIAKIPM